MTAIGLALALDERKKLRPGPLLQDIAAVTLAHDLRDPRSAQQALDGARRQLGDGYPSTLAVAQNLAEVQRALAEAKHPE